MSHRPLLRKIEPLDLASFKKPQVPGNRGVLWRAGWYMINAFIFNSAFLGLLPNNTKANLMRAFGARVGKGLVCKPRVNIKYPWFLELGDHVWIGEGVWIDNLCPVTIGNNVCLSQGVKLVTGNHDWSLPSFPFFASPITIGDGVWVTAFRVIRPGVQVPAHTVVLGDLDSSFASVRLDVS